MCVFVICAFQMLSRYSSFSGFSPTHCMYYSVKPPKPLLAVNQCVEKGDLPVADWLTKVNRQRIFSQKFTLFFARTRNNAIARKNFFCQPAEFNNIRNFGHITIITVFP